MFVGKLTKTLWYEIDVCYMLVSCLRSKEVLKQKQKLENKLRWFLEAVQIKVLRCVLCSMIFLFFRSVFFFLLRSVQNCNINIST